MPQRKSARKASSEDASNKSEKKLKRDHDIEKAADKNGSSSDDQHDENGKNEPHNSDLDVTSKEHSGDNNNGDKVEKNEASSENNGSGDDQLPANSDGKQEDSKIDSDTNDVKTKNSIHDDKSAVNTSTDAVKEDERDENDETGVLLICGGTNWDLVGRKELPKSCKANAQQGKNLWGPHIWKDDVRVRDIISSCTACHSVIITEDGQALVFGRNDKGQLGVGDLNTRHDPTMVETFKNIKIKSAATGKGHTLFLTQDGVVYAVGDNKMGQLGIGSQSSNVMTPTKVSLCLSLSLC